MAQRNRARAQRLAVPRVDRQRHFHLAEFGIPRAGAERHAEFVLARRKIEFVLASMIRRGTESIHLLLRGEVEVDGIAHARCNRSILLVCDAPPD